MKKKWENYEEVATHLLNQFSTEFGLARVEGKQKLRGQRSGTDWVIDAKGIRENNEGFIIIECRRYTTSRQNQEKTGGLAYRIIDTGADGGIIVSPLGIQAGAAKIAVAENIVNIQIDANSTATEFCLQFLDRIMTGVESKAAIRDHCIDNIMRMCKSCGKQFKPAREEKHCIFCQTSNHTQLSDDKNPASHLSQPNRCQPKRRTKII